MDLLIPTKIVLSAGMVIGVTLVAERLSPRFAGVLLGFPLGAGLTFFFVGIEQGPVFATRGAPWCISGLSASLVFCYMYEGSIKFSGSGRFFSIFLPTFSGIVGYFGTAWCLQNLFGDSLWLRAAVVTSIFLTSAVLFRRAPTFAIKNKVPATIGVLTARAVSAAAVILLITSAASMVGPEWTGIFGAFPTTLLPSMLVLHYHYGGETIPAVLREIPFGMVAIIFFSIGVYFSFPLCGVFWGIVISYSLAFVYLLLYEFVLRSNLDTFLRNSGYEALK